MAFQGIVTGFTPNDGQGDTLLAGAIKTNDNFRELYEALGDGTSIGIATLTQLKLSGILTATSVDVPDINISGILSAANVQVSGIVTANSFSGDLNGNVVATSFNSLGSISVGNQVRITSAGALQNIVSAATSSLTVTGDSTLTNVTAGVVTATEFNGIFNGTFSGNSIGLSGSPDIEVGIVTANTGVGIGTSITNTWLSFPTGSSISSSDIIRAGSSALDYTLYALKSDDQHVIRHVTTGNYTVSVASTNQFTVSNSDGWGLLGSIHPGGVQDSDTAFVVRPDTSTELRYNYDKKFETTGYGVSVTGGINVSGVSTFQDNIVLTGVGKSIQIGPSNDQLSLEHDANGLGLIRQNNELFLSSPSIQITNLDGSNVSAEFLPTGGVGLRYNNSTKLQTTVSGVDVTGHTETDTLNVSGVATAAGFVGPLTGDATGLSGSPSINVTNITASGNVSIAGTLTYEDVTNIDAIGLITARSGVQVDSGGIDVTGVSTFQNDVAFGEVVSLGDYVSGLGNLRLGDDGDLRIHHNGSNSLIRNATGSLYLQSQQDNERVHIQCDDGSGGIVDYFAAYGNTGEARIYHYGNQKLATKAGGIDVTGHTETDTLNVSGITSFQGDVSFTSTAKFDDNVQLRFGNNNEFKVRGSGTDQYVQISTGNLYVINDAEDKNIQIQTDNGSGGTATYFRAHGSTGEVQLYHYGTEKFATKPYGVEISGGINASGIATLGSHTLDANDFKVGTTLNFKSSDGSTNILTLNQSGSVDLYHNTNKKFETTASGVEVTGGLVADNLSVSGVSTLTGLTRHVGVASFFDDVNFLFDDGTGKVTLGPNKELEIFHANATGNSVIKESGSGSLILAGDNVNIRNAANNKNAASFISNGAANLFFNNGKKFETTSIGASVLGTLTATAFVGDGSGLTGITTSQIAGYSAGGGGGGGIGTDGSVNTTGIITASSFSGDGSSLTGIVTSIVAGNNVTLQTNGGEVTINASGGVGGSAGINVQNNGVAIGSTITQTINFNNDLEATVNGSVVTVNSTAPSQATAIALAIALG